MATAAATISAELRLDIANFKSNITTVKSQLESVKTSLNSVADAGKSISSAGSTLTKNVTLPIMALGTAAVKTSADYEAALSKVQAISGATAGEMAELDDKAQQMGASTKFSAKESAEAFQYMAMAGWDAESMVDGIDGIMSLAAADGLDLATTSDIVTDALTAFGLSASDSSHFADVLATASSSANTNVSMLGESFKYVAPVCGALGFTAEDTALALGLMANSGIKSSQAGTALRAAMTNMVSPTETMALAMEELGLNVTNSDGTMKSLRDIMEMLKVSFSGLTEEQQAQAASAIFGKEAMSGMLAIINSSDKDFDNLASSIDNADGRAQEMADTMLDNLNGQITIIKSSLEGLAIEIGNMLLPTIKSFAESLQEVILWLQGLSEEQKETILKIAGVAAAIGPLLIVLGKLVTFGASIGSMVANISSVFAGASTSAGGLAAALGSIASPAGIIIASVAALGAAIVYLWNTNEDFKNGIISAWDSMVKTVGPMIDDIVKGFQDIWVAIKPVVEFMLDVFGSYLVAVFEYCMNGIKDFIQMLSGLVNFIAGIFTGDMDRALGGLKDLFGGLLDFLINALLMPFKIIGSMLGDLWLVIGDSVTEVWNNIVNWLVTQWSSIVAWATDIFNGLGSFFTGLWAGIVNAFTSAWEGIRNFFTSVVGAIIGIGQTYFGGLSENIKGIFAGIVQYFTGIWEVIKNIFMGAVLVIIDLFTGNFTQLGSDIKSIWQNIKNGFSNILGGIKTIFTNVITALKTLFIGGMNRMRDTVTLVWNVIKATFTNVFTSIKATFVSVWNAIVGFFTGAVNGIKTKGVNAFNALKSGISNTIVGVKNAIVTGMTNAVDFIKNLPGQAVQWGADIISNIASGITGAISKVTDAASSIASGIRDFLHFSVPDKGPLTDFQSYMPDMISGLVSTLKSSAPELYDQVEQIASTMSNMLQPDVALAYDGAMAGVSGGGGSIQQVSRSAESIRENGSTGGDVNIQSIVVRDDEDMEKITKGIYDHNDKSLRAMGRRNI